MSANWCRVCCSLHPAIARCPGDLRATGPERPGFRVNVETPTGVIAYVVLLAQSWDLWRARILTLPRTLWTVPGGGGSIKFIGTTRDEAEHKAIEFVRSHCEAHGFLMRDGLVEVRVPDDGEGADRERLDPPAGPPAERKAGFVWVRFGVDGPTESGKTGNLSETGLFVITDSPVVEGRWVEVMLETDDEPITLRGMVRWMRKTHHAGRAPGMGIQIEAPPPDYVDYVREIH